MKPVKANDAIMLIRSNRKAPPRAAKPKPKPSVESLAKRQRREAHEAYDAARRAAFVIYDAAKRQAHDSYDAEVRQGNDESSSYDSREDAMRAKLATLRYVLRSTRFTRRSNDREPHYAGRATTASRVMRAHYSRLT